MERELKDAGSNGQGYGLVCVILNFARNNLASNASVARRPRRAL